uniref:RRM domain-containing protein n=1 Tax=Amorphochlora amoebiformis TaxID=1561963 RepID=A0A7S0H8L6_9EUKA|mmetsp:Transcript_6325/g.9713  ORF Transcript_6325/g.9713 Transcript_6325/m.9713 type:complete len:191 (+) Transcript_6325:42-614(+)
MLFSGSRILTLLLGTMTTVLVCAETESEPPDGPPSFTLTEEDFRNHELYISNLPADIKAYELAERFGKYGKIRDIRIVKAGVGRSAGPLPLGYGFVEYFNARDAMEAMRGLRLKWICGRVFTIEPSKSKRKRLRGTYTSRGREHDRGRDWDRNRYSGPSYDPGTRTDGMYGPPDRSSTQYTRYGSAGGYT